MKLSLDTLKVNSYTSQISEVEITQIKGGTPSASITATPVVGGPIIVIIAATPTPKPKPVDSTLDQSPTIGGAPTGIPNH